MISFSTFCWNVRGINNTNKRRQLRNWIRHHKPLFWSVIETRVKEEKSQYIINKSFPGWSFVGNYEHAALGRIWVLWDSCVSLSVISKSDQMITCSVTLPRNNQSFTVSFVYARNCRIARQGLWEELGDVACSPAIASQPWVVLGDFNQSLNPYDNSVGGTRISAGMYAFRNCLLHTGLSDLAFQGPNYTWWNHQEDNPIAKKLDRVLCNDQWRVSFPLSFSYFGEADFSDHCPSCLSFGDQYFIKKPFKVSNFLLQNKDYIPRLFQFWSSTHFAGTSMFILSKKLKLLKSLFKDINREQYSHLELRVQEAHSLLLQSQEDFRANPSSANAKLERSAHRKWLSLSQAEGKFLFQRSKVKWIKEGDANTSFFHKVVNANRSANQIHYLLNDEDVKLESDDVIQEECIDYFTKMFGTASPPLSPIEIDEITMSTTFRCSEEDKAMLEADITNEDIKAEFFALPPNKSPGPDGFNGEFFRSSWAIIGDDVTAAIHEFFSSGRLLKQWNSTIIALIPKKEGAHRLKDFRPISLCNALYKVVSKLLARRLQHLLPKMISNSQAAFVKDRLLVENVLLASELVQGFNSKSITPRGMLQVDIRKAFDTVRWDFLIHVLEVVDFPIKYINWVKECISSPSFSVCVNGSLHGYFQGNRGLRQGDPISPSLFLIAMEVFANILQARFRNGSIGYHPLCLQPSITHLAFADDVMVFFDGKETSLQGISLALDTFYTISGLAINREKSSYFVAGLNENDTTSLQSNGYSRGDMPVRYLGLPLMHRKLRVAEYSPLIDKISAKFNNWTTKVLSFAGRLQLIKSVIYSLLNFWMGAFILPRSCLKKITKLCSGFLWAGDISKRTIPKVSWRTICLPKWEGGLGLRDFTQWNRVLHLKLIWLLFSSSGSLWVAWIHAHRLNRDCFWNTNWKQTDSWLWKSLLNLKHLAKLFLRCKLGNGRVASFWFDHWLPSGPLIATFGNTAPLRFGLPSIYTVAQACSSSSWRLPTAVSRAQDANLFRNMLLAVPPPSLDADNDSYYWDTAGNSYFHGFKTAITWNHLRYSEPRKTWHSAVWFRYAVPKHAFTFWTANLNRLPVKARLVKWGVTDNDLCCVCSSSQETREHLFLWCDLAASLWSSLLQRLGESVCLFASWHSFICWLQHGPSSRKSLLRKLCSQALIFTMWKERNNRLHHATSTPADVLFLQLDRMVKDILLAQRSRKGNYNLLSLWFTYS